MNPYCACGHVKINHRDRSEECLVSDCPCGQFNNNEVKLSDPAEEAESPLVEHARRELKLVGNDDDFNEGVIQIVKIFASQGHSGGSAPHAIRLINDLLQHKALGPLTDDPDEWTYHSEAVWGAEGGVWQNKRDSRAFSINHGQSYFFIDEVRSAETPDRPSKGNKRIIHDSETTTQGIASRRARRDALKNPE